MTLPGPMQAWLLWKQLTLWRSGFMHSKVNVLGRDVHYWRGGSGSTVVLIHGLGASTLQDFAPLCIRLSRHFTVVSIDLPGFGFSPGTGFEQSIPNQARLVLQATAQLGLSRFHLVGNSMGGWISLEMAASSPRRIRHLALVAPAALDFDPPPIEIFLPETMEHIRMLSAYLFHNPPEFNEWFYRDWFHFMRGKRPAIEPMIRSMMTREHIFDTRAADIPHETLILFGENDRVIPCDMGRRLAKLMPNSQLVTYPDCAHLVLAARFEDAVSRIEDWFLKAENVTLSKSHG